MIKIKIYNRAISLARHSIRLLYNLGPSLEVNDRTIGQFDIFLANDSEELTVRETENSTSYALFFLDKRKVGRLFRHQNLFFECDSSSVLNGNYAPLQDCLAQLLLSWSDDGILSDAEFAKYSYNLCLLLMNHFRVNKLELYQETLAEKLRNYIERNFREELTLSKISSDFYMTPQYFSKVFKENVGHTFYKYLTHTRLSHAKSLLDSNEKNLLQIALESGFSNINSLNRSFREAYQLLPSDYRRRVQEEWELNPPPSYQELSDLLKGQLVESSAGVRQILKVDAQHRRPVSPYWKKVINIGPIRYLNSQKAREQLTQFQSTIRFEFVRLQLELPKDFQNDYSFYLEENILDFLVKQGLKFQIVIDYRQFVQESGFGDYLKQFISHFSNRYSIDRVRQWRFELDYMTVFDQDKCLRYGRSYQELSQILFSYKVEESLYGPGFVLGDMESFRLFESLRESKEVPNIQNLTFHVRQDVAYWDGGQVVLRKITDSHHVANQLEMLQKYLDKGFHCLHIVEWKDYSPQRSWINDTSFKAADIIRTALACLGEVADVAWNIPLDCLVAPHSGQLLVGYEGCVTNHGIAKPSLYAHQFLHRHGDDFLAKDDYSLVTSSGHNITIVSHHRSQLHYRYYLEGEESGDYPQADFFENTEEKKFTYHLQGVKAGNYLIKTRLINSTSGSVKEISKQVFIDGPVNIGDSEIEFLKKQAVPRLTVAKETVLKDVLTLSMTLQPNEIRHTHIIYLY